MWEEWGEGEKNTPINQCIALVFALPGLRARTQDAPVDRIVEAVSRRCCTGASRRRLPLRIAIAHREARAAHVARRHHRLERTRELEVRGAIVDRLGAGGRVRGGGRGG